MDTTRSPPVPIKKTLVLVNDFLLNTTRFLNHFYTLAEEKLRKVASDIERVETSLILLESRLARVPGMEEPVMPPPTAVALFVPAGPAVKAPAGGADAGAAVGAAALPLPPPPPVAAAPAPVAPPPPPPGAEGALPPPPLPGAEAAPAEPAPPAVVERITSHPDYAPLFRMMKIGAHPQAVKNKAAAAGLNPDLLDNPDAPITAADAPAGGRGGGAAASPAAPPPPPPAASPAAGGGGAAGPEYDKYVKMTKMGLPAGAVRQKMAIEAPHLDPTVIGV